MGAALHVRNLTFGYRAEPVLRDITLPTARAGEVTGVIGPNAAGKSTLLRCIAGFHRCAGRIHVEGGERSRGARGGILYLPQDPPPPSSITVFDAVLLARRLGPRQGKRSERETETATTLAELGLDELATRRLSELSGGQRQLVGLAQAMVRRPDVLLLDEPTSNLDLRNQLNVLHLVRRIARSESTAVLAVVHDLTLAARIADQLVVLDGGAVHATGTPDETITADMLETVYRVTGSVHTADDGSLIVAASGATGEDSLAGPG